MTSAQLTVDELLTAVQRRLRSFAVALIVPKRGDTRFCGPTGPAATQVRDIITAASPWLLAAALKENAAVIYNRVRQFDGGPLLGRFLAASVPSDQPDVVGVLIAYNEANGQAFGGYESRVLGRYLRLFSNALTTSRDSLTGLPNRLSFEERVRELCTSKGSADLGALLYGDIDQLHVVNDLWGFEFGDRAIAHVSAQLKESLRDETAVVSRLSGDRFTIFLPNASLPRAREAAERLRAAVSSSKLPVHDEAVQLTMSWGVALLQAGDNGLSHGLAAAEIACKAAKDRGRNRVEAYEAADESIIRRHDDILIIRQLRSALDAGRIKIFGQPIARLLQQDETLRYEMLVRVLNDDDKLVMPSVFMSAATRYQLLPQLDRLVISHVLGKVGAAMRKPGYRPVHVSLNLSGPTICQEDFLEWLVNELTDSGVPGSSVGFEFTETAVIENLPRAQSLIDALGKHGCSFALDDFGTGSSSLALINTLRVSTIKIDGSFIRDLLVNKRSESLVRAIAQLANSMGMEVVAEYVESPEICMRLIELQVQFGQGYAIGRPRQLERILDPNSVIAQAS
jgi:Amt family ammonium transporter